MLWILWRFEMAVKPAEFFWKKFFIEADFSANRTHNCYKLVQEGFFGAGNLIEYGGWVWVLRLTIYYSASSRSLNKTKYIPIYVVIDPLFDGPIVFRFFSYSLSHNEWLFRIRMRQNLNFYSPQAPSTLSFRSRSNSSWACKCTVLCTRIWRKRPKECRTCNGNSTAIWWSRFDGLTNNDR